MNRKQRKQLNRSKRILRYKNVWRNNVPQIVKNPPQETTPPAPEQQQEASPQEEDSGEEDGEAEPSEVELRELEWLDQYGEDFDEDELICDITDGMPDYNGLEIF